jgi:hypothetical protein
VSKDERPITEQLKQVVDDLQLEDRVKEAAAAAEEAVLRGLEATGSYVRDHRADIEGFIERATATLDRQTSGRFAEQVEQVRSQLTAGVAGIADRQWTRAAEGPGELAGPDDERPEDPPAPDAWSESTDR